MGGVACPLGKSKLPTPRNTNDLKGGPLENAAQVSGKFPLENGPKNTTIFRAENNGTITSYAVYDSAGMIIKRVDVTGKPHAGVPTPHVLEYGRNSLPDGTIRVDTPSGSKPRTALPNEIP